MSYLARLHELKAQKPYVEAPTEPTKPGFVSFGSDPRGAFSENHSAPKHAAEDRGWQSACPAEWVARLAMTDPASPPKCFSPARWRQLLADAAWLAERHGAAAHALGWSASDLFGLDDHRDHWGGLADRLEGTRNLKLNDRIAHWRNDDASEEHWLWRATLRPMRNLWSLDPQLAARPCLLSS